MTGMSRKARAAIYGEQVPCMDCGTLVTTTKPEARCEPCGQRRKDTEALAAAKQAAEQAAREAEEVAMQVAVEREVRRRKANARRPLGTWSSK